MLMNLRQKIVAVFYCVFLLCVWVLTPPRLTSDMNITVAPMWDNTYNYYTNIQWTLSIVVAVIGIIMLFVFKEKGRN